MLACQRSETALHYAVAMKDIIAVHHLLDSHVDANARSQVGGADARTATTDATAPHHHCTAIVAATPCVLTYASRPLPPAPMVVRAIQTGATALHVACASRGYHAARELVKVVAIQVNPQNDVCCPYYRLPLLPLGSMLCCAGRFTRGVSRRTGLRVPTARLHAAALGCRARRLPKHRAPAQVWRARQRLVHRAYGSLTSCAQRVPHAGALLCACAMGLC